MARKRNRKSKSGSATSVAEDRIDRGTAETRGRLSPDPLLSSSLDPHRAAAGLAIREALEDGVGAKALDMVRIGMGGGASSGHHEAIPLQRHIVLRDHLNRWRRQAAIDGLHCQFAEEFSLGHSIRQIAQRHVLSRHKVTSLVNDGLDLYADMRGFRRQQPTHHTISVWDNDAFVAPVTDQHIYAMPAKAALRHRNTA